MLWFSKHPKIALSLALLVAAAGFFYYSLIQPAFALYQEYKVLPRLIRPARNALLRQDLATLVFEMRYLRPHIATIKYSADKLSVFSFLPKLGAYFKDFRDLTDGLLPLYDGVIDLAASSQDVFSTIKFVGWGSIEATAASKNSEGLPQSLAKLSPQLYKLKDKFSSLSRMIVNLDENNYPTEVKGRKIRENIKKTKDLAQINIDSFDDVVSTLNLVPKILGLEKAQSYLLLIQNEKEVRPGGGLISGYVILSLEKSQLKLLKSGDAASLGADFKDANSSPDFKISAQNILSVYAKTADPLPIQGVIAVNGQFLSSLIRIVGEIKLEDGTTVNGENIEKFLSLFFKSTGRRDLEAQKNKTQTSIFLNELLKKAITTLPQTYLTLLPEVRRLSAEKHLLVYFEDGEVQNLAEKYNLAGRVKDLDGDYLQTNHDLFEPTRNPLGH